MPSQAPEAPPSIEYLSVEERSLLGLLQRSQVLDPERTEDVLRRKRLRPETPIALLLEGSIPADAIDACIQRALGDFYRLIEEGDSLARIANPHVAANKYSEALSIKPADAAAHLRRALAYVALDDVERAATDLDRALDLDPRSQAALHARALLRVRRGDLAGSLEDANRALALGPTARLHLDRALIYHSQREDLAALLDYHRAAELDPSYTAAFYHRGTLHLLRNEREPAWRCFRTVLESPAAMGEMGRRARRALERLLEAPDDGTVPCTEVRALLERSATTTRRRRSLSISGTHRPRRMPWGRLATVACVPGAILLAVFAAVATWSPEIDDDRVSPPKPVPAIEAAGISAEPAPSTSRGILVTSDSFALTPGADIAFGVARPWALTVLEYSASSLRALGLPIRGGAPILVAGPLSDDLDPFGALAEAAAQALLDDAAWPESVPLRRGVARAFALRLTGEQRSLDAARRVAEVLPRPDTAGDDASVFSRVDGFRILLARADRLLDSGGRQEASPAPRVPVSDEERLLIRSWADPSAASPDRAATFLEWARRFGGRWDLDQATRVWNSYVPGEVDRRMERAALLAIASGEEPSLPVDDSNPGARLGEIWAAAASPSVRTALGRFLADADGAGPLAARFIDKIQVEIESSRPVHAVRYRPGDEHPASLAARLAATDLDPALAAWIVERNLRAFARSGDLPGAVLYAQALPAGVLSRSDHARAHLRFAQWNAARISAIRISLEE